MIVLGVIFLVVGTMCRLYASVFGIYDTTLKAMGASALKTVAAVAGTVLIVLGEYSCLGPWCNGRN